MGKKQHQKDRNFLTAKEWKEEWGGFKKISTASMEHLPFFCCALSFTNFEDPVATADGTVYEVSNIVPYINKFKTNPVTGTPMEIGDLIPLKFHKNSDNQFECPILKKVFNQFTHIVAIRTSGNVFSFEAVQQFNIKLRSWHDLLTDEAFTKEDIIHIQQPTCARSTAEFDHIKKNLRVNIDDTNVIRNSNHTLEKVLSQKGSLPEAAAPSSKREIALAQLEDALRQKRLARSKTAERLIKEGDLPNAPVDTVIVAEEPDWRLQGPASGPTAPSFKPGTSTWDTDTLAEARKIKKATDIVDQTLSNREPCSTQAQRRKVSPAKWWATQYRPRYEESVQTVGHAARSFTSTIAAVTTKNEFVRKLKQRCPSEKAYLTVNTSKGPLNVELACDLVPRTCENFIVLCEMGYYTGTIFHRSIRNFMVQGGDPTGIGRGGESIYGATFADEFDNRLLHNRRGVLAMANHGKDTNGSQFYILYKSARHLDFKHTVFGSVVGGLETLSAIEAVSTDDEDRPCERIKITGCVIHKNPYRDIIRVEEEDDAGGRSLKGTCLQGSSTQGFWYSDPRQGIQKAGSPHRAGDEPGKRKLENPADVSLKKAHRPANTDEFDAW